jgi:hypothetical protein
MSELQLKGGNLPVGEVQVTETPPKTSNVPGYGYLALLALICIVLSGAVGVAAAKYFVVHAPPKAQSPQVMILDAARITDEAMKSNPKDPQAAAMQSIATIKERINQLTSMGIIVIDRSSVIEAPEGAFINVNSN